MCGAPKQGGALAGIDLSTQTVIQGQVWHDGAPVAGAYVRLLDGTDEFTAEVVTSPEGEFRFFAAPGKWKVRSLAADRQGRAGPRRRRRPERDDDRHRLRTPRRSSARPGIAGRALSRRHSTPGGRTFGPASAGRGRSSG